MVDDLAIMIALAQSHAATGKPPKYIPALELAYARTIAHIAENWEPKRAKPTIILTAAKEKATDG